MPHIFNIIPRGFAFRSSREDLGGQKLTGDLKDENTGHLERKATKRRDSMGTRLIYSLMFLDNNSLRSWSPWKNVRRLFKKKRRWNMRKYSFTLFPCFCFRLLWLWFVFLDSVSVLRFNFVFFCVRFRLGMLISVLGFVFLFPGSVFLFWVSVLSYVFLFWVCSLLFLLLLLFSCGFLFLSATLYIW